MRRTFEAEDYKSKSQLKREAHAAAELARPLVELKVNVLKDMPLSEAVFDAVIQAKTIKSQGALKRQLQYIGGLLREEEDLSALRRALATYLK